MEPTSTVKEKVNWWERWLQQPQRLSLHRSLFQLHFWIGAVAGAYLTLMSITGSIIVYRNQLPRWSPIGWLVNLHSNLLAGSIGRLVNGIGGVSLTLLCLTGAIIWWPGVKYWRRSLQVNWRANFPRINWDLHSAFGFWCFPFVSCGGFPDSILGFPKCSRLSLPSIPLIGLQIRDCFGCPNCTLEGLTGLRRRCGRS